MNLQQIDVELQQLRQEYKAYKQDLISNKCFNENSLEIHLESDGNKTFHIPFNCTVLTFKNCFRKMLKQKENWKCIFKRYKFTLSSTFEIPMSQNSFVLPFTANGLSQESKVNSLSLCKLKPPSQKSSFAFQLLPLPSQSSSSKQNCPNGSNKRRR